MNQKHLRHPFLPFSNKDKCTSGVRLTLMVESCEPEMICGSTELVMMEDTDDAWPPKTWIWYLVLMSQTCGTGKSRMTARRGCENQM